MGKDSREPNRSKSRNTFCGMQPCTHILVIVFSQVPGASVILFNFTFFNIVDQTDMVELLDGYSNQVMARFDGRNPPRDVVNVTSDFIILYFYSDRTNEAQGFSVLYHGEDIYAYFDFVTFGGSQDVHFFLLAALVTFINKALTLKHYIIYCKMKYKYALGA